MRPRPDAAENWSPALWIFCGSECFNEAAARCRGKRRGSNTSSASGGMLQ